jgi:hypothetical protein
VGHDLAVPHDEVVVSIADFSRVMRFSKFVAVIWLVYPAALMCEEKLKLEAGNG